MYFKMSPEQIVDMPYILAFIHLNFIFLTFIALILQIIIIVSNYFTGFAKIIIYFNYW
jgi:hypothetical protein